MGIESSLRERKKLKTYNGLVEAAFSLFKEQGFEATTVEQIADRAEVSRRTFFRYFATKESIAFPHHAERLELFEKYLSQRIHGETPLTAVRRCLIIIAREYEREREQVLVQATLIESSPTLIARDRILDLRWEEVIAEALSDGVDPSDEYKRQTRLLAGAVVGVIRAALREWMSSGCQLDLVKLGTEALDLLARGTGTE